MFTEIGQNITRNINIYNYNETNNYEYLFDSLDYDDYNLSLIYII